MTQKRIACLLAQDFQDEELTAPLAALKKQDFMVDIVGARAGDRLEGKHRRARANVDVAIDDASVVRYLGVIIPGGQSPTQLAQDPRFCRFVREFNSSGKPIAAICHGPQLLIAAGLCKDRTLTAAADIKEDVQRAGARFEDRALVSDGNWITSRTPADLQAFCEAIVAQFESNANQSWMARGDVHPDRAPSLSRAGDGG